MKPHIRSALVTAALLAAGPARAQAPEPGWFAFAPPDDPFAGDALLVGGYEAGSRIPPTVLFFDDAVREVYFDWAREIFTAPNCDRRSIAATWLASRP